MNKTRLFIIAAMLVSLVMPASTSLAIKESSGWKEVSSKSASTQTTSAKSTLTSARTKYCNYVPDRYKHFDFSDACMTHDQCYLTHAKSRYYCDKDFYANMRKVCSTLSDGKKRCTVAAYAYYRGVRAFGAPIYNQDESSRIYQFNQRYNQRYDS